MKKLPLCLLLSLLAPFQVLTATAQDTPKAPATPQAPGDAPAAETPAIDATPYKLDRFSKLLNKSPFDFDVAPIQVEAPPPPMQGWMISGVSGTDDYTSVTIIHEKSQNRLTLTKYNNPNIKVRKKKDNSGEEFKLIDIQWTEGKPHTRKFAKAIVQKGNDAPGEVSWESKADQMKPMVGVPNIQIPTNNPIIRPQGAQQINANGQIVPQTMQNTGNNTLNFTGGQPQAFNNQGNPNQPVAQGANPNGGAVTSGQQELLNLLSHSKTNTTPPPGGAPGNGNSPLGRRRVILPTPNAPAPPVNP